MDENNQEQVFNQMISSKKPLITNELTQLGNLAVKRGLISGHGYHGGKYEILCLGQLFQLTLEEAHSYLKSLVEKPR